MVYFRNETVTVSHVSLELAKNKSGTRVNHLGMEDDNSRAETPQPETLETFYMEDQRLMAANLTLPERIRLPDAISLYSSRKQKGIYQEQKTVLGTTI